MPDTPNLRLKGVKRSRPSLLFRRIVATLKASHLTQCVNTWKAWEEGDDEPLIMPTAAQCPMVRLTPSFARGGTRTNIRQGGELTIGVEVWCKGFDITDPVDLFDRIVDIVYSGDQVEERSYRAELQALGADSSSVEVSQPATPLGTQPDHARVVVGRLSITYRIQGP